MARGVANVPTVRSWDMVATTQYGSARKLAQQAVYEGITKVIAAGGDGVVREVASGVCGSNASMGIIPLGDQNRITRSLGFGFTVQNAIVRALCGKQVRIDVGRVDGNCFLAGTGFPVIPNERKDESQAQQVTGIQRLLSLVHRQGSFPQAGSVRARVDVTHQDTTKSYDVYNCIVANGSYINKRYRVAQAADMTDGLFDVCLITGTGAKLQRLLPDVYGGRQVSHPDIHYVKANRLTVSADKPFEIFVDGEVMRTERTEISMAPGALTVLFPDHALEPGESDGDDDAYFEDVALFQKRKHLV